MLSPHRRLALAALLGLLACLLSYGVRQALGTPGPGDFRQSLQPAQDLLAGRDPYSHPTSRLYVPSPLPAALLGLPLAALPPALAGAVFFGASSGLLAWAVLRAGELWRLLLFASWPYAFCLAFYQYPPLVVALAYIPALLPVALVKPQVGLPLALARRPSRLGLGLAGAALLLSLALDPGWPPVWFEQAVLRGQYEGFVPLLWRPGGLPAGLLVLLALVAWRRWQGRAVLLFGLMPQRMFYDQLLLLVVPGSARQMALAVAASWLGCAGLYLLGGGWRLWVFAGLYLPALALLVWGERARLRPPARATPGERREMELPE